MYFRKLAWLSAAVGVSLAGAAWAEDAKPVSPAAGAGVEEVVVTARRRTEDLKNVPVEVSVVATKEIHALNINNAQDVSNIVSGLQTEPGQSQGAPSRNAGFHYSIRGQSGSTGVVTYVDEVPNFPAAVFDLSNIQVLKGPQGTLFGAVTTGGAVLLQPMLPTNDFNGFIDLRSGSHNAEDVEFGVGGAVVPNVLAVRFAGVSHTGGSFTRNLFDGSPGDGQNNQAYRFTAKLDLGRFEDVALVAYSRNADQQRVEVPIAVNATDATGKAEGITAQIPASLASLQGISCTPTCPTFVSVMQQQLTQQKTLGKYQAYNNAFGRNVVNETAGFINTASFKATDWLTLRDIFSWRKADVTGPGDSEQDGFTLPVTDLYIPVGKGVRTYTNEFQAQVQPLQSLHLTGGYYYEHNAAPTYQRVNVVSQLGGFLSGASVGFISTESKPSSTNQGFYGQADWKVIPRLSLTGGLRYTKTDVVTLAAPTMFSQCVGPAATCAAIIGSGINLSSPTNTIPTQIATLPGGLPGLYPAETVDFPGAVRSELKAHKVTYTAAIAYEFSNSISAYATTRTGYKPGGFNSQTAPAQFAGFGPENVTDYEAGIKTRWNLEEFYGTANLAIYKDDYKNIQRSLTVQNPVTGGLNSVTANAAAATIKGFDLDVTARFRAFELTGYWSYTDAGYTKYPNTGQFGAKPPYSTVDLTQQPLADVSKNRYGLRPSLHLDGLGLSEDIVLSANIYYRSQYSIQAVGVLAPLSLLPGRTIFDLRADWNKVRGTNLGVALGMLNAGNYRGLVEVNDQERTFGYAAGEFQQPRTEYVQIHYAF